MQYAHASCSNQTQFERVNIICGQTSGPTVYEYEYEEDSGRLATGKHQSDENETTGHFKKFATLRQFLDYDYS